MDNKRNMGGKKKKRGAKFSQERAKREMVWKAADQEYGVVDKMLGDMRCWVVCADKKSRVCHIRGRFRRRVWINIGDVVVVSVRPFEQDKGDIIYKYNLQEIETLKSTGTFNPETIRPTTEGVFLSEPQLLSEEEEEDTSDEEISLMKL